MYVRRYSFIRIRIQNIKMCEFILDDVICIREAARCQEVNLDPLLSRFALMEGVLIRARNLMTLAIQTRTA